MVAGKTFREDLYYRLNVLQLHLPPLRERETDTRFLLNHFLRYFAEKAGENAKVFSSEAVTRLMAYPFPGNIRELRNIVEYCANICQSRQIESAHLPKYLFAKSVTVPAATKVAEPGPAQKKAAPQPSGVEPGRDWLAIERELIVEALTRTRGNRSKAADILGWGRTTLWRKLKAHGLMTERSTSRERS